MQYQSQVQKKAANKEVNLKSAIGASMRLNHISFIVSFIDLSTAVADSTKDFHL